MRIHEVMKKTGLTKKAIYYYEAEGFIQPDKDNENQYRNYSEQDIQTLMQISFFRRLDLSMSTIREILENPTRSKSILRKQINGMSFKISSLQRKQSFLEELLSQSGSGNFIPAESDLEALNNELIARDREYAGYMQRELQRIFPGMLGMVVSIQIGQFLDEPLDSQEKVIAWEQLVKLLDAAPDMETTEETNMVIEKLYGQMNEARIERFENMFAKQVEFVMNDPEAFKRKVSDSRESVQSHLEKMAKEEHFIRFNELLEPYKGLFNSMEQYILILSSKYRKYHQISNELTKENRI
ncbi:MAG: MerR family transcriptional regulator [Clostridia bacterium]|nr:MerR family transcriptional regulator [Clostridia bacterium]